MGISNFLNATNFLKRFRSILCLISFFFCTIKPQTVNAKLDNMQFGIIADYMLTKNIGVFYEYDFIPFLGVRIGLEHGNDFFMIVPKGLEFKTFGKSMKDKWIDKVAEYKIDSVEPRNLSDEQKKEFQKDMQSEWGYYEVSFISIPLSTRIYPFSGDLALNLGLRLDILISGSGICVNNSSQNDVDELKAPFEKLSMDILKTKDKISAIKKDIGKEEEGFYANKLLNSTRLSFISGFDYTFFFGLILGFQHRTDITNFINYDSINSEPLGLLNQNIQVSFGLDIAKIIML